MIDERTADYLIARLDRVRYRAAMANAGRRSWLDACVITSLGGHELVRFTPGAAVDELAAIAANLGVGGMTPDPLGMTSNSGAKPSSTSHDDFSSEIDLDDPGFDEALAEAARGGCYEERASGVRSDAKIDHSDFTVEQLVAAARQNAAPIKVDDLAAVLLLAKAVAGLPGGVASVLAALSSPRPIVTVISPVAGFADALRHLISAGIILPGPMWEVQQADTRFQGTMARTRSAFRPMLIELRAGENDGLRERSISVAEIAAAFQTEQPILVQAPSREALPQRLRDASTLLLDTGPLDGELLSRMITILRGSAPSIALNDCDLTSLGLVDLTIAMRPGIGPDGIADCLRRYAAEGRNSGRYRTRMVKNEDMRAGAGRSGGKAPSITLLLPSDDPSAPRIETLAGYGAARSWALDLKLDVEDWKSGAIEWSALSPRLLLSGPPGTGKTVWAKALGNSLGMPVLVTSASSWLAAGHLGDVLVAIERTFADARNHTPCILFIDEIDGVGRRDRATRDYDDYWVSVVNKVLELMDGAVRTEGVVVVGASNRPDALDPALLRAGRLETHIVIAKPDHATLAAIIAHHLGNDLASVIASAPAIHRIEAGNGSSGRDLDPHCSAGHAPDPEVLLPQDAVERGRMDPEASR